MKITDLIVGVLIAAAVCVVIAALASLLSPSAHEHGDLIELLKAAA